MTPVTPNCYDENRKCKFFDGFAIKEDVPVPICKAFPDGIPQDIAFGNNQHKQPIKGQIGKYVFEEEKE
jgi:hypothetical protein